MAGSRVMERDSLLDMPQLVERLSVGRTTVYRLINEGKLRQVKVGDRLLVASSEVDRFIQSLKDEQW